MTPKVVDATNTQIAHAPAKNIRDYVASIPVGQRGPVMLSLLDHVVRGMYTYLYGH